MGYEAPEVPYSNDWTLSFSAVERTVVRSNTNNTGQIRTLKINDSE